MPVKDRRTKILLLFFLLKDTTFDYVKLDTDILKMFDLTLNQKTKGTISAMLKEGIIEKSSSEGAAGGVYRMTEKGFDALCLEFPGFRFIKNDWDGMWRIISYEIPEKKRHLRDRLRREMKGWGLGPWHRSFWITAHPVIGTLREIVYGREDEKYILAFEATHLFGDLEVLVEKVWEKTKIEASYKALFKKWHDILSQEGEKPEKLQKVLFAYIDLLKDDPGLPPSLVGRKWIGFEAFGIFKEMRSILMSS